MSKTTTIDGTTHLFTGSEYLTFYILVYFSSICFLFSFILFFRFDNRISLELRHQSISCFPLTKGFRSKRYTLLAVIGNTRTFLYFDVYPNTAYAAYSIYFKAIPCGRTGSGQISTSNVKQLVKLFPVSASTLMAVVSYIYQLSALR